MNLLKKNVIMLPVLALIVLLTAFTPVPEVDLAVDTTVVEWPLDLYQSSYANRSITLNIREGQTEKQAFNNAQRVLSGYDFELETRDEFQIKTMWVYRDSNTKRVRVLINNNSSDDYLVFSFKFQSEEKSAGDWVTVNEIPNKYKELLSEIRLKLTGF